MAGGDLGSGYEALARGESGPLLGLLAPKFEWVEPDGSVRSGPEAALAALGEGQLAVEEVAPAGRRTLVTGTMRAAGVELPFAHVWESRGGELVRAAAYFDHARLNLTATRRQLADAADELLEQAAEIRGQWSRLGDALRAAGLEAEEDRAAAGSSERAAGRGSARLAAVDMAHEGSSREEVELFLRDELGVEDVAPILDEVFAAEREAASADSAAAADPAAPAGDAAADSVAEAAEANRLARLFARNRG